MAQSAFAPSVSIPRVTDASLLQQSGSQVDPNYNSYQPLIDEADQLTLTPTKISTKTTAVSDKLANKQKSIDGTVTPTVDNDNQFQEFIDAAQVSAAKFVGDTEKTLSELTRGVVGDAFADGFNDVAKNVDSFFGMDDSMSNFDKTMGTYREGADSNFGVRPESRQRQQALNKEAESYFNQGETAYNSGDYLGYVESKAGEIFANIKNSPMMLGDSVGETLSVLSAPLLVANVANRTNKAMDKYKVNNQDQAMPKTDMAITTMLNTLSLTGERVIVKSGIGNVIGSLLGKNPISKKFTGVLGNIVGEYNQERFDTAIELYSVRDRSKDTGDEADMFAVAWNSKKAKLAGTAGGTASATMVGGGIGATIAPKVAVKTLGAALKPVEVGLKKVASKQAEKRAVKSAQSYAKPGYATTQDKTKHKTETVKAAEKNQSDIDTLTSREKEISTIAKGSGTDKEKVQQVQAVLHKKGITDNSQDSRISVVGKEDVDKVLQAIINDEVSDSNAIKNLITRVSSNELSPLDSMSIIGQTLAELKQEGKLSENVKTVFNDSKISIDNQVAELIKDKKLFNITYKNSVEQLKKERKIIGVVDESINQTQEPKTKLDVSFDSLMKLSGDELNSKLAEYDNKVIASVMKEAQKRKKTAKSVDAHNLAQDQINSLSKVYQAVKNAVKGQPTDIINKTGAKVIKQRVLAKKVYDPKKDFVSMIKEQISDKLPAIAKTLGITDGNGDTELAGSTAAVQHAVNQIERITNIPLLQKAITDLQTIGNLSKSRADGLHKRINEYIDEKEFSTINTEGVKGAVKEGYNKVVKKSKTITKEEVQSEFTTFFDKLKDRLSPTEKSYLAAGLAKLQKTGKITKEYAESKLDELTPEEGLTKENIQKTFTDALDTVKSTISKDGRETIQKDIGKKVDDIKSSPLGKEVIKDTSDLHDIIVNKLTATNFKEVFDAVKKKVPEFNTLEMYRYMKDLSKLKSLNHDVTVVDELLDENGKPIVQNKEGEC